MGKRKPRSGETAEHQSMRLKVDREESQIIYHRMLVIPTPGYSTAIMGAMIIIIAWNNIINGIIALTRWEEIILYLELYT